MSKTSAAFKKMEWDRVAKAIVITFHNESAWSYPSRPTEYATLCRGNVSAGKYLNRVLKNREGAKQIIDSLQARRPCYWPGIAV